MFQLIQPTTVKLMHINVRTEKHGASDVDAVDLDLHFVAENRLALGMLHPDLCEALYHCAAGEQGQGTVEGLPDTLPNLRFPKLAGCSFAWDDEATGVDLTVIYGLGDEKSNIKLEDGKATMKRVEVHEGGSATNVFRFSVSGYPDGVIDKLRKKLKQEITITLVQPERLRREAIDGSKGHPALEGQGALCIEDDGTSGPDEDEAGQGDDGEGSAPDSSQKKAAKRGGKVSKARQTAEEAFASAHGAAH